MSNSKLDTGTFAPDQTQPIKNDGPLCRFCHKKTVELKLFTGSTRYCPPCESNPNPTVQPKPASKKLTFGPTDDWTMEELDEMFKNIGRDSFLSFCANYDYRCMDKLSWGWYGQINGNPLYTLNIGRDSFLRNGCVKFSTVSPAVLAENIMDSWCDIHQAFYCIHKQQKE